MPTHKMVYEGLNETLLNLKILEDARSNNLTPQSIFLNDISANVIQEIPTSLDSTTITAVPTQKFIPSHLCNCACDCERMCFCNSIFCGLVSDYRTNKFDPGTSLGKRSKGSSQNILFDINRDYLFVGTSTEPPRIPASHREITITND